MLRDELFNNSINTPLLIQGSSTPCEYLDDVVYNKRGQNKKMKMKKEKGFTVVEILVALVLISFGIFGVLNVYTHTVKVSEYNTLKLQAQALCNQKATEMTALGLEGVKGLLKMKDVKNGQTVSEKAEGNPRLNCQYKFQKHHKYDNVQIVYIDVVDTDNPEVKLFNCEVYIK